MKLAAYLNSRGITLGEFARQINAKNARTVQRYIKHGRIPSGMMMARIAQVTGGAVSPSDFCDFAGPAIAPTQAVEA